jgi:hypothetical protein
VRRLAPKTRAATTRLWVALWSLLAFLAAQTTAVAHVHPTHVGAEPCAHACSHSDVEHAHDGVGRRPAAPHDAGSDDCALCRVLGAVPAPLSLPAPLPLPERVVVPRSARPSEPARPPILREGLARGPPSSACVASPRAGSRA